MYIKIVETIEISEIRIVFILSFSDIIICESYKNFYWI